MSGLPPDGSSYRATDVAAYTDILVDAAGRNGEVGFLETDIGYELPVMAALWSAYKRGGRSALSGKLLLFARIDPPSSGGSPDGSAPNYFIADQPYQHYSWNIILYKGPSANILSQGRWHDRLIIPVNPDSLSLTYARNTSSYDIIRAKQKLALGPMQLRTVTFSSFFPQVYDPDYCYRAFGRLDKTGQECYDWIVATFDTDTTVTWGTLGFNAFPSFPVIIGSFTPSYKAGDPDDVWYDITLTEARLPTVHKIALPGSHNGKPTVSRYTTRTGDTLIRIATKVYGKGYASRWKLIQAANRSTIRDKFGKLDPGPNEQLRTSLTLHIPDPSK